VLGTVGANTLPLLLQYLPILFDQARLQAELQKYGFWSALIFVLLHMVATMIGIPGVILTIVGGVLFGLVWGSLWSLIGATLGAIGAFWVARSFLHDWIQCRLGHHQSILTFNEAVERHALTFVLVIRFAPISPFNLANFLFGLTTIHWFPYSLGTFLGIIPGVITYTWVGVTSNQAIHGHNPMPLLMACSLLAILSALPLVLHRDRNRYS
jgi:uncharacterized membrane protein YdjX (TVP38/TMEM64 family)